MESRTNVRLAPCVCASLRQVTRAATQLYDDTLRPSGLRAMQFNILMTIRAMEEATVSQLAEFLLLDQTTLTRSLNIIEKNGWVQRVPKLDRRVRAFRVSRAGLQRLRQAEPLWNDLQARVLDEIGQSAWQSVRGPLADLARFALDSTRKSHSPGEDSQPT